MTPVEVLRAARARLASPDIWVKYCPLDDSRDCTLSAVGTVISAEASPVDRDTDGKAVSLLYKASGRATLADWNDAPERTLDDVLALYDRAIDLAKAAP